MFHLLVWRSFSCFFSLHFFFSLSLSLFLSLAHRYRERADITRFMVILYLTLLCQWWWTNRIFNQCFSAIEHSHKHVSRMHRNVFVFVFWIMCIPFLSAHFRFVLFDFCTVFFFNQTIYTRYIQCLIRQTTQSQLFILFIADERSQKNKYRKK